MSSLSELSRWDNNARHEIGALITACEKLRTACAEHDAVDEWMRSAKERGDAHISVQEGNAWTLRDYEASDAMGAAIDEIVDRLNALDDEPSHATYKSRAESEPLFAGPQGEPPYPSGIVPPEKPW